MPLNQCKNQISLANMTTIASNGGATVNKPTEEDILRKPWKYIGYKGYSSFLASEDEFFILRRFNTLNVRIALSLQDEISWLENKLSEIDQGYSRRDVVDINNGTLRDDQNDRAELLNRIIPKIRYYNDFIIQQTTMNKYQPAPSRVIESIRNWHFNHDYAAINKDEQSYLDHEKDLISVLPKDKSPVRRLIDHSRRLRTFSIWKRDQPNIPDYDATFVSYYSDKRIDGFASGLITSAGVILLISPIWILQSLQSQIEKLVVITVFIFVFLLALSFAMATKPFEALGATAAYAAVLMVFLQLGSSS
ncbi:uncharacterized protein GGS22DRAFT_191575 [Annulohypoxylon maeteangense]|uniref:uncharacterized protein n=1 Tax=Annulohypoxylon maeteangense TaxID=1927788 RepID=UPI002007BE12|nr:uncharacterized protein GGS22DRAFT_191575 [Annulohypoxylon maeteangense]KAI0881853.1 hypothetical protein GGS22DRAFT_191575 [Annulohypoxylon maeteangense]